MIDVFASGVKQDIAHVLRNRDARVSEQNKLFQKLQTNQSPINAKLNIPGPIKNNYYLAKLFQTGLTQFVSDLEVRTQIFWDLATGPEAFLIVENDPYTVKKIATDFEDNNELGRLFDIDVLVSKDGMLSPLSRSYFNEPERKCLLCDKPAKVCARSRTHSVLEMQNYISKLINENLFE